MAKVYFSLIRFNTGYNKCLPVMYRNSLITITTPWDKSCTLASNIYMTRIPYKAYYVINFYNLMWSTRMRLVYWI